jgi:putative FmdB family regulatory protein
MPTYEYQCSSCDYNFDIYQPFSEETITKCPSCRKKKLYRVVTGGLHSNVLKVETIGQLADKNSKINKSQIEEQAARKKESEPPVENRWYDKYCTATSKEVNKMSDNQKMKYIMRGEK